MSTANLITLTQISAKRSENSARLVAPKAHALPELPEGKQNKESTTLLRRRTVRKLTKSPVSMRRAEAELSAVNARRR